jgi:hypothetical protein
LTEITIRQQNGDPRFLSIALRVAEREDRRWQNTGGSGASPLFGVRVAERDDRRRRADPRSRELTELEGRVAGLEGEGNEPSREKSKDDHREPTGETASEALDADAFADEGDELPLAETTAAPEKEEGPAAREATRFGTATRPHLNPLPKGEGTEAPKEKEAPVGDAGASACIGQPRRPPDESEHDDAEPPGPSQTVAGSGGNRQPAGDDDDRRAATPPKKRATSSPRPFFAASSSRATPYD